MYVIDISYHIHRYIYTIPYYILYLYGIGQYYPSRYHDILGTIQWYPILWILGPYPVPISTILYRYYTYTGGTGIPVGYGIRWYI